MSKFIYPLGCNPDGESYERRRVISRFWKPYLTANEFLVLDTIFDRTDDWKKKDEKIPMRHFLEGFTTKKGKVACLGMSISKNSVSRALKTLEKREIIKVTRGAHCREANTYEINYYCVLGNAEAVGEEANVESLNPVQNLEKDVNSIPTVGTDEDSYTPTVGLPKKEKEEKEEKLKAVTRNRLPKLSSKEEKTPRGKIQNPEEKTRTRSKQTRTRKMKTDNPSGWETTWRDELEQSYPGMISRKWGGREFGIMNNLYKTVKEDFKKRDVEFGDFLRYSVRHWVPLLESKGSGVQEYNPIEDKRRSRFLNNRRIYSQIPREPSVRYFSACADMFLQSYSRFLVGNCIDLPKEELEIYGVMKEEFLTYAEASKRYAHRVVAKEAFGRITQKEQMVDSKQKALAKKERDLVRSIRKHGTDKNKSLNTHLRFNPDLRMKEDLEPLVIVDLPDWEDLADSGRVSQA